MISLLRGNNIRPWNTTSYHTFQTHRPVQPVESPSQPRFKRNAAGKLRHNLSALASRFRVNRKQQVRPRNIKLASELPRHLESSLEPKQSPGASLPRVEYFSAQNPKSSTGAKDDTELTYSFVFHVSIPSYPKTDDTILNNPTALEMTPPNKASRKVHQSRDTGNRPDGLDSDEDYLTRRKREAVDRLMAQLEADLDKIPFFRSRSLGRGPGEGKGAGALVLGGGGGGSNHGNKKSNQGTETPGLGDKGDAGNTTRRTNTGTSRNTASRKRGLLNESGGSSGGGDGSESGDDHDDRNKQRSKKTKVAPRTEESRMACPFFKRDPEKHNGSSCTGPGFLTIARLKEHIYRKHTQRNEHRCLRCAVAFKSKEILETHSKAEKACDIASQEEEEERRWNGGIITQEQETKLRKKDSTRRTTTERWKDVYRIVFPDDKEENIPASPYYQYTTDFDVPLFLKEELIDRVREKVEASFDQCEEKIRNQFVVIVQTELSDLIKNLPQSLPPSTTTAAVRQQATPPREIEEEDDEDGAGVKNVGTRKEEEEQRQRRRLSPSYSTETFSPAGADGDVAGEAGLVFLEDGLNPAPPYLSVAAAGERDLWGTGLDIENFYGEGSFDFLGALNTTGLDVEDWNF